MATETPNLGLIKPARGEFNGTWDIPMNANSDTIDGSVGGMQTEIATARGSASTLNARLSVSLNADGTLVGVPEVAQAENSPVYGANNGSTNYTLKERIDLGDYEVFNGRQGAAALRDALANAADDSVGNTVLSAPTGFLSFTGANVKVDGSVTPVVCNINGYRCTVRSLKQTTVSGSAGTYYVYLQRGAGDLLISRTGGGQNTGNTLVNLGSGYLSQFNDSTQNFVTSGVQAGDILAITSSGSANAGNYVVASVIDPNNLLVIGLFQTVQANLNYSITNPLAPSLSFTSTAHSLTFEEVSTQIFIGEAVFDGTNVTSVLPYAIKGRYAGFTSITLSGGGYNQTIAHNLGYFPKKILFYGSQASDFSSVLEPLATDAASGGIPVVVTSGTTDGSTATITSITTTGIFFGMAVAGIGIPPNAIVLAVTSSTVVLNLPTTSPGTPTLTFSPNPNLTGALQRSVICAFDHLNVYVKNASSGVFYLSYGGTTETSGFLYVAAER